MLVFAASADLFAKVQPATFTVSLPERAAHRLHVVLRCEGLGGELQDFKMPAWSPGFYGIGDYARNVSNFRVSDGSGRPLPFEKIARNTWRVAAANAPRLVLEYDVFGATSFAANTYVGEDRAYLSPSGVFLYTPGGLQNPVAVNFEIPSDWKQIATGLDAVSGKPGSFKAPNFNVLYDCPVLMGNQESLEFQVKGVPHYIAMENVASQVSRPKMVADLKRMVEAATQMFGDIPYSHYTFLLMGRGNGGIEHLNSASIQFAGDRINTDSEYLRWLSYVCHEYFHNFNVKRIRPIALGPFDYEQENLTRMLWVSEGLSVYYQDLLLVRAGLMTRQQYLDKMAASIGAFENASGRRYQSATESSWNTWNTGSGIGGDRNVTISYYNNGAMLGAMLDLQIRQGSGNRRSLDDVMRTLYRTYYLEKKRGFTDAEFQQACESAAGGQLAEVFEYAATPREIDYAKYFALAGLRLEFTTAEGRGADLQLDADTQELSPTAPPGGGRGRRNAPETRLVATDFAAGSPAEIAGVKRGDLILQVENGPATAVALSEALAARKAGDKLRLRIGRNGGELELEATLVANLAKTYRLLVTDQPSPAQSGILRDWLRSAQ